MFTYSVHLYFNIFIYINITEIEISMQTIYIKYIIL